MSLVVESISMLSSAVSPHSKQFSSLTIEERTRNKDVLSLPFPFFSEIIQVTPKPASCLQALPKHIRPFSGMPHTFPLLSTNLHELLPPLQTLLLKQNAISHIQHTAPAGLRLSAQLSCSPASQTAPGGSSGIDLTSLAGQVPAALCWQSGWHTPAHQLQANPRTPHVLAVLGSLRSPQPENRHFSGP